MEEALGFLITQPEKFTIGVDEERSWILSHAGADNSVLTVAEQEGRIVGWIILRGGKQLTTRHTVPPCSSPDFHFCGIISLD